MSDDDDDWLSARPDPEEQRGRVAATRTERQAVPAGYGHHAVPPPKLLQRPKGGDDGANASAEEAPVPKTLKQKEAEYAAARARIFGSNANGTNSGKAQGKARGRGGRGPGSTIRSSVNSATRQKVDDEADPDYNRNPELYVPRFSPTLADGSIPSSGSRYVPPTYESEFPALGR